eukprot:6630415-Karenia_brevis.AAC.1
MNTYASISSPKTRRAELFRSIWVARVLGGHDHANMISNMDYDNHRKPPMVGYSKGGLKRLAARCRRSSNGT